MFVRKSDRWFQSCRTGRLSSALGVRAINKALGFSANTGPSGDGKVTRMWRFEAFDDRGNFFDCAIWDYKGARWSTYGPPHVLKALFHDAVEEN